MNKIKKINDWEVLTPSGWSNFSDIKKIKKEYYLRIEFNDNSDIKCSDNHKIKKLDGNFYYAKDLIIGDVLPSKIGDKTITNISIINEAIDLYDLLNVEQNNEFYSNDLISHNCAFIDSAEDIWLSAQSTLSTGGNAILLSTPNGVGQFFHKMWIEAEEKKNDFNTISLRWNLHPDRDQKWRDDQDKNLGPKGAAQECDCAFLSSGNTVVDMETIQFYRQTFITDPLEKRGFDHNYWIWSYPDYARSYLVCADVARGDASDFSSFHVIDIENAEQVAEYRGKVSPKEFGNLLVTAASDYNNALLVIENATIGYGAIQQVIDRQYPNLFYSSSDLQYVDVEHQLTNKINREEKKMTPGFTTSSKTRPLIISKLESYFREQSVRIKSLRLIEELFVFIWHNGKAEAMRGYNDDLVMSLAIGLWVRDTACRLKLQGINLQKTILGNIGMSKPADPFYTNKQMEHNPWEIKGPNGEKENLSWLL